MSFSHSSPTALLDQVAQALAPLLPQLVFVGGATVGILLTDPAAEPPRFTKDVDIAAHAPNRAMFAQLEMRLNQLQFSPDTSENAPMCRWVKGHLIVDLLADNAEIQGFTNPWYASAILTAEEHRLPSGLNIRVVNAPHLIATKLVAWQDRGQGGWYSHDLEDIMLILDGRPELFTEIQQASTELKQFVSSEFGKLLSDPDLHEMLPTYLASDSTQLDRASRIEQLLKDIHQLGL